MGFIDRAKEKFADKFGDEVVKKGSFGVADEESEIEETPIQKTPRAPREKRLKSPKPEKAKPVRQPKPEAAPKSRPTPKPKPFPRPKLPAAAVEENPKEFFTEEDVYEFPEAGEVVLDKKALSTLAKDQGQTAKEVLSSMNIQETFTIDDGILFLDEELANQSFETQYPYGYDMGEVDFFLIKSQRSVAEYVRLLRIRNDDTIKLASRISDLMVEVNNLRFNSEMANGINIMAGSGDDDAIAVELDEARLRIRKLTEDLSYAKSEGQAVVRENPDEIARLRNELSAEQRTRTRLEGELQDLRAHIVDIEEEYDIEVISDRGDLQNPVKVETGYESYSERRGEEFKQVENLDNRAERELYEEEKNFKSVGRDHWLNKDEELVLPDFDDEIPLEDSDIEESLEDVPLDDFEENELAEIDLISYDDDKGVFNQDDSFGNSAFSSDPYQNLDEFIEQNQNAFPEDNKSTENTFEDDDDPDEDGFQYSFERNI